MGILDSHIVAYHATETDFSLAARQMSSQSYVITDATDRLCNGGRIRSMQVRRVISSFRASIITTKINSHASSYKYISFSIDWSLLFLEY